MCDKGAVSVASCGGVSKRLDISAWLLSLIPSFRRGLGGKELRKVVVSLSSFSRWRRCFFSWALFGVSATHEAERFYVTMHNTGYKGDPCRNASLITNCAFFRVLSTDVPLESVGTFQISADASKAHRRAAKAVASGRNSVSGESGSAMNP